MKRADDWTGTRWGGVMPVQQQGRATRAPKQEVELVDFCEVRVNGRHVHVHVPVGYPAVPAEVAPATIVGSFERFWRRRASIEPAAADDRLEAMKEVQDLLVRRVRELETELKQMRSERGVNLLSSLNVPSIDLPAPSDEDSEFFAEALAKIQ